MMNNNHFERHFWGSKVHAATAMSMFGIVYLFVGVFTWHYDPGYLAFSRVWAFIFFTAGWSPFWFIILKKRMVAALSGGLLAGSAFFRSAAIFTELGPTRFGRTLVGDHAEEISASFSIASLTWFMIGVMVWLIWPPLASKIMEG